jgi:hypothetical protein
MSPEPMARPNGFRDAMLLGASLVSPAQSQPNGAKAPHHSMRSKDKGVDSWVTRLIMPICQERSHDGPAKRHHVTRAGKAGEFAVCG